MRLIEKDEAIDTAPVVRCSECAYYHAKTGWCDELSLTKRNRMMLKRMEALNDGKGD